MWQLLPNRTASQIFCGTNQTIAEMKKETEEKIDKGFDRIFSIVFNAAIIFIVYEWKGFEVSALFALVAILSKLDRK